MLTDSIDLEAASAEARDEAPLSLQEVVKLGEQLEQLSADATKLELQLKEKNAEIQKLSTVTLPTALQKLGLRGLPLASGVSIDLQEVVSASITDANRGEALLWLRDNDFGDIIKNEVKVTFGKGEDDQAAQVVKLLEEMRRAADLRCGSVEQKETVNFQTLNAFVRERLAKGEPLPLDTFKVYIGQVVKLKKPKEKLA